MSSGSGSQLAVQADLADAIAGLAVQQGAADPRVRGADWRQAIVATVGAGGLVTTTDGITARRLDTYGHPAVGDRIIITCNSQGSWIAAGRLAEDTTSGAWTPYTPVWTSTGATSPVVGNGVLKGRYAKHGRTVVCHIEFDTGTTTTPGTGDYRFSLPVQAANLGFAFIGHAYIAGGSRWQGQVVIGSGSSTCAPYFPSSSTSTLLDGMSPTKPEAWANATDILRIDVTYESAT